MALVSLAGVALALSGRARLPATAADEWVAVRDTSLTVAAGSALDFTDQFSGTTPAGSSGHVIANAAGHLAFEASPDKAERFLCASLSWSPASGSYPDKKTADIYAEQLRRHGYNMARLHFVDANLMTNRDKDFDFDPEQLDRFRYLLAALKRNGIAWTIDVMTSQNGAIGGIQPHRWDDQHTLKLDVHLDAAARRHWVRLAIGILATNNPYTGLPPLKDPALALLVLVNEGGLDFVSVLDEVKTKQRYPAKLQAPFDAYLRETYKTDAALAAAWDGLESGESLDGGSVRLPRTWGERGPRVRDLMRFFARQEPITFKRLDDEIRGLGYRGLTSAYNNWATTAAHRGRKGLPVVTGNTYFEDVLSFEPGVTITQKSSLADGAAYLGALAGARWYGKPFFVTEHQHMFWNRYRHESGLIAPAMAAIQGWDGICRHGPGAVDLTYDQPWPHKQHIYPYEIGLDPIGRASETLAALIYRRGDMREAAGKALILSGEDRDMLDDGQGRWPDELTKLALLTRLGLVERGHAEQPNASLQPVVPPDGGLLATAGRTLDKLLGKDAEQTAARVAALRKDGLLPSSNTTDPLKGLYQSETGELTVDTSTEAAYVVTPRTEAAVVKSLATRHALANFTLEAASGPALVSASALDATNLADSRRTLIIFATDARNTAMTFRDSAERTIADYGRFPVLLKRQTVKLSRPARDGEIWRLTPLHLDGRPGPTMRLTARDGRLTVDLDTAASGQPVTTYFLLER